MEVNLPDNALRSIRSNPRRSFPSTPRVRVAYYECLNAHEVLVVCSDDEDDGSTVVPETQIEVGKLQTF